MNHDGQITADEVPEEQRRLFDRLVRRADKNGDGKLSREEFLAGMANDHPKHQAAETAGGASPSTGDAKTDQPAAGTMGKKPTDGQATPGGGFGFGGGFGGVQEVVLAVAASEGARGRGRSWESRYSMRWTRMAMESWMPRKLRRRATC